MAPETTSGTLGWLVFWFVLGYAFYSVLYATAGSLVSRQEEAQSIRFPITGVLLIAYFFALTTVESPDSAVALVGSLLPPTAPMVMTVRIANGGVPWWQIVLSVGLMVIDDLRHGAAGGTDLRGRRAPVRRPAASAGCLAGR